MGSMLCSDCDKSVSIFHETIKNIEEKIKSRNLWYIVHEHVQSNKSLAK